MDKRKVARELVKIAKSLAAEKSEKYDGINSMADLKALMKKLGMQDNKVRTVSIVFGRAYVRTWDFPSKIHHNAIGDSPMSARGYWYKGKLKPFSEKLITKHQNVGLGSDR